MAFDIERARDIRLAKEEIAAFRPLSSPEKIQDYITAMPSNWETNGDSCYSARLALRHGCCHCIEAAFIAAGALMLHGQPAILLDFQALGDDDHVVAIFKRGRHWGAISKSNSIGLRWRDPVYASHRELAMSYFHEYSKNGRKTLRRLSKPFNIGAYDPAYWLTAEEDLWDIAAEIHGPPHFPPLLIGPAGQLTKRVALESEVCQVREVAAD